MAQRGTKPPYTAAADIETFFERLKHISAPPKVTTAWIEAMNLASVQPEGVPGLVKWLGLADKSGVPDNELWNKVRVPSTRAQTLAPLVKKGYEKVFGQVDVEHGTRQDIEGAFIASYSVGGTQKYMTAFLAICEVAGITVDAAKQAANSSGAAGSTNTKKTTTTKKAKSAGSRSGRSDPPTPPAGGNDRVPVTVNLNVEIPADWDEQQIRDRWAVVSKVVQGA